MVQPKKCETVDETINRFHEKMFNDPQMPDAALLGKGRRRQWPNHDVYTSAACQMNGLSSERATWNSGNGCHYLFMKLLQGAGSSCGCWSVNCRRRIDFLFWFCRAVGPAHLLAGRENWPNKVFLLATDEECS